MRPSPLEFELLVVFASDPLRVFHRDELARSVWHSVHVSSRTVDSHVCHLRNRLTDAGATTCSSTAGATAGH